MRKRVHFVHEEKLLRGTKREVARLVVKNARHIIIISHRERKSVRKIMSSFSSDYEKRSQMTTTTTKTMRGRRECTRRGSSLNRAKEIWATRTDVKEEENSTGGCGASENNARG